MNTWQLCPCHRRGWMIFPFRLYKKSILLFCQMNLIPFLISRIKYRRIMFISRIKYRRIMFISRIKYRRIMFLIIVCWLGCDKLFSCFFAVFFLFSPMRSVTIDVTARLGVSFIFQCNSNSRPWVFYRPCLCGHSYPHWEKNLVQIDSQWWVQRIPSHHT